MNKLTKLLLIIISIMTVLTHCGFTVFAEEGDNTDPPSSTEEPTPPEEYQQKECISIAVDTRVRTGPGTKYAQLRIDGELQYYNYREVLTIIGEERNELGELWYNVIYIRNNTEYQTWIREDFVQIKVRPEDDPDFEQYLTDQGFPETYKDSIRQLHALHPTWVFTAYNTGLEWVDVIKMESRLGYNLINGSNLCYRSVAEGAYDVTTGKFKAYDGTGWFCANSQTIAYYIDPRNFLNESNIFMFLTLSYKETETEDVVQRTLDGTFMSGRDSVDNLTYASIFVEAGQVSGASPIYLAVLARQEQGGGGSAAITGGSFTYNGKTYSGLYNFYNIGATGGTDNWKKGLVYANGGANGENTSYGRPWNSPRKSIIGGAQWIVSGYISGGQDTMYLQKFNVTPYSTYTHQYMTNVRAPHSQSSSMYTTYKNAESLEQPLVFSIPIFNNMPAKTELPTTYHLPTTLEEQRQMAQDDPTITPDPQPEDPHYTGNMVTDLQLVSQDGFLTGFAIGMTYGELKTKAAEISDSVVVKITNGETELKDDETVATGYKIEFAEESGSSFYTIIIRGDINGDGKVNIMDLLLIKKDILDLSELSGSALKAALTESDTEVSLMGYLLIKKHILGLQSIPQ